MADYHDYVEYIHREIKALKKSDITLTEQTDLVAEAGLTSLQVMELVQDLEDHFDISVPLNILPEIDSIADLAERLVSLDAAGSSPEEN